MRVLVCGSRTFNDKKLLYNTLDQFCVDRELQSEPDEYGNWLPTGIIIIEGKAKGADLLAGDWAIVNWVPLEEYPAEWDKYGRAAGPIRNQQMLDTGIDVVIAFPVGETRGTQHMMDIARKAGVEVIEIRSV
jgi:hypothetical protein